METLSDFYKTLLTEAHALIEGETDRVANTANIASLVYTELNEKKGLAYTNWVCVTTFHQFVFIIQYI
jgi:putative methionine-R-sulfoxide reductase with GAF domain